MEKILIDKILAGGKKFRKENFNIDWSFDTSDHYSLMPPDGWLPEQGKPTDWPEIYYIKFKQEFEPAYFCRNILQICNFSRSNPHHRDGCAAVAEDLIERALERTFLAGDARFVEYSFEFPRRGYTLSPGWVSALGNGFVLRALMRAREEFGWDHLAKPADELASAYLVVNKGGGSRPWFTFVDEHGYLWLDEYPADDGYPTLVMNGHIHALIGLFYYCRMRDSEVMRAVLDAALTTVRRNVLKFRREGKVSRYSIREGEKDDYLPARAVRQLRELGRMTGDGWFRRVASLFQQDIDASHAT